MKEPPGKKSRIYTYLAPPTTYSDETNQCVFWCCSESRKDDVKGDNKLLTREDRDKAINGDANCQPI